MRILSIIKPFDKPINAVGASWSGCLLNNELINYDDIEELAVVTNLPDYSPIDNRIDIFEIEVNPRKANKEILGIKNMLVDRYGFKRK